MSARSHFCFSIFCRNCSSRSDLIDEEYTTIAYLVIPFAFAVSFIKYRLFDIEVIINRSIVYRVLTLFIGAAYVVIVLFLTSVIGGQVVFEGFLYVVAVTLIVALLINPLRKRIQRLVDESLFAARNEFSHSIDRNDGKPSLGAERRRVV